MQPKTLIILGCGYIGTALALAAQRKGIQVSAVVRDPQQSEHLTAQNINTYIAESPTEIIDLLQKYDALLDSIPLEKQSHPHAPQCTWLPMIKHTLQHMQWVAYLSSSSVYGDHQGAWVNENTICKPNSQRGKQRLQAEKSWRETCQNVRIFRLSGIYGSHRNILKRLKRGQYKALCQPHFSNRIHCDDIVTALLHSMHTEKHANILNLSDDAPLPHYEYVCELAQQAGYPQPERITKEQASQVFSAAYLDFFHDNKRICNKQLHQSLLPTLKYPSFRHAIHDLLHLNKS